MSFLSRLGSALQSFLARDRRTRARVPALCLQHRTMICWPPERLSPERLEQRLLLTGTLSVVASANVSSVAHGGTVTYRFDVRFTPGGAPGDPTAADGPSLSVVNGTCSPVTPTLSGGFNIGDADTDNDLDSSETWRFTCTLTVPAHSNSETDPIQTTAVVTGNDANGAAATAGISNTLNVDITHAAGTLAIAKSSTASTVVHGGTVTYRFDVSYTTGSDGAPAKNVAVTDAKCDATPTLSSGDTNSNNLLDSGETWRFGCTRAVAATHGVLEQDPILNSATVSGQDFDGDALTSVTSNQVSVDILHGTIRGVKFLDLDSNGTQGVDDPDLGGWTINLFRDSNSNGTFEAGVDPLFDSQVTDAAGAFTFDDLIPGTYFAREALQAGFTQTTSNPAPVVITAAETASGLTFGNHPPPVALITDPCDTTKTALLIVGTASDDTLNIARQGSSDITVRIGNTQLGTFSPTGHIIVYSLAGNDKFQVSESISLPMLVRGGAGNDRIFGANGDDILIGDSGNDQITGRRGRDVMIGGTGADTMLGSRGDDILIAGTTDFDSNDQALCAILAEWISSRDYVTRITNLRGTGSGPRENDSFFLSSTLGTVHDDGVTDRLTGGGDGLDWFLARLSTVSDRISKIASETVDPI